MFRNFVRRSRYNPVVASVLYGLARPVFGATGALHDTIGRVVRRNSGVTTYDGVNLTFPRNVGVEFLTRVSWLGRDGFEPDTWRVLRSYIKDAGTFIDIGAHIGFYSVLAKCIKPDINVMSFEPVSAIHGDCVAFQQANGCSTEETHRIALSDNDGEAIIYVPRHDHEIGLGHSAAGTLVNDSWQARKSPDTEVVRTARLDAFLKDRELKGPVIIKIDVEDFEAAVLSGAHETVRKYKPAIVCEILPREHDNAATWAEIKAMGYTAYAITPSGCFRFDDFSLPRNFTDFLLIPDQGTFIPCD